MIIPFFHQQIQGFFLTVQFNAFQQCFRFRSYSFNNVIVPFLICIVPIKPSEYQHDEYGGNGGNATRTIFHEGPGDDLVSRTFFQKLLCISKHQFSFLVSLCRIFPDLCIPTNPSFIGLTVVIPFFEIGQWANRQQIPPAFTVLLPAVQLFFEILESGVEAEFTICPLIELVPISDQAFVRDIKYCLGRKIFCSRILCFKGSNKGVPFFPENIQYSTDHLCIQPG